MSSSIIANRCPQCDKGQVFTYFFSIHKNCPECGLKFEKEEGYFFGPMIISYFVTLILILPVFLFLVFKSDASAGETMFWVAGLILLIGPVLYRYSKLVWLHLETRFANKIK